MACSHLSLLNYPEWAFWLSIGFPVLLGVGILFASFLNKKSVFFGVFLLVAYSAGPAIFAYLRFLELS